MANEQTDTYIAERTLRARFPNMTGILTDDDRSTIIDSVREDFAQWNLRVPAMLSDYSEDTGSIERTSGSTDYVTFDEVGEIGRGVTQTSSPGSKLAFPLHRFVSNNARTETYRRLATLADFENISLTTASAFLTETQRRLQIAMFSSSNRNVRDKFGPEPNTILNIKAFYNSDGTPIPRSPNDATQFNPVDHDHYNGEGAFTAAGVTSLVTDNIMEHQVSSDIMIVINKVDVTKYTALTPADGWDPALRVRENINSLEPGTLARVPRSQLSDYYLGALGAANVWVKQWGVPDYSIGIDLMGEKALARRLTPEAEFQGLRLTQEFRYNPLTVNMFEALFGFGANNRSKVAVLFHTNATYADPVFPKLVG